MTEKRIFATPALQLKSALNFIPLVIFTIFAVLLCLLPFFQPTAYLKEKILYSLAIITCSLTLFFLNHGLQVSSKRVHVILAPLLLLFSILLSTIFSNDPEYSVTEFYKYASYVCVFLCALSLPDKKKIILILALAATSAIVSIRALQWVMFGAFKTLDILAEQQIPWEFAREYLNRGRAFVPFIFPSELGSYLILCIPVGVALALQNNAKKLPENKFSFLNALALFIIIPDTLALFCTQSLGAIISLSLSAAIFIFFFKKRKMKFHLLSYLAVSIIALTAVTFAFRNSANLNLNLPLLSVTNRISYWQNALKLIGAHPLTGLGPGNYPFFKGFWAHNSYLQAWVEFGILGIISLIYMAVVTIKTDLDTVKGRDRLILSGAWVGSLAFLIHNLVDSTILWPAVSLQWWAIAGVLASFFIKNKR